MYDDEINKPDTVGCDRESCPMMAKVCIVDKGSDRTFFLCYQHAKEVMAEFVTA